MIIPTSKKEFNGLWEELGDHAKVITIILSVAAGIGFVVLMASIDIRILIYMYFGAVFVGLYKFLLYMVRGK